jgi:1A family penicillin-binding protein
MLFGWLTLISWLISKGALTHKKLRKTIRRLLVLPTKKTLRVFKMSMGLPKKIRWRVLFSAASLTGVVVLSAFAVGVVYERVLKDLPHPNTLSSRQVEATTKIFDRNGQLLYKIYDTQNRTPVALHQIPPYLVQATLAVEDRQFYTHAGLSLKGILRALQINLQSDETPGGSTITQQLIKNALLNKDKTMERKVKEAILALMVETYYTKDEILEMYFNEVGYGGPTYGIEEASQYYFNKSVTQLSLGEAALLAGLPVAPSTYSPYGAHPEKSIERQAHVLRRMVEDGYITLAQAQGALTHPLAFATPTNDIKAPHFVMYARSQLELALGEQNIERAGLSVTTSLDGEIQELAQKTVNDHLQKLGSLGVSNAAALITNPETGEVIAMVGSGNYFDISNDGQVNVTLRPRQPGSSIKPITYAAALERGLTPATIIEDTPVTYSIPGSKDYKPVNYDGKFHGKVTLRNALANSYNVPAVKTLDQLGVSTLVNKARDMGITTWEDSSRFGLSLALGAGEVKMVDMAVAYGAFANGGYRTDLNPILHVTNHQGKTIQSNPCLHLSQSEVEECKKRLVVNPAVAFVISDILSDNIARSSAFGRNSVLHIPNHQVAVKTGTTNNLRDNWTFGYTKDYLVATWVGNNNNAPMSRVASGITGASAIWHDIMIALLADKAPQAFSPPGNLVKMSVCPLSPSGVCTTCAQPKEEYFIKGFEPQKPCSPALIGSNEQPPTTDSVALSL